MSLTDETGEIRHERERHRFKKQWDAGDRAYKTRPEKGFRWFWVGVAVFPLATFVEWVFS